MKIIMLLRRSSFKEIERTAKTGVQSAYNLQYLLHAGAFEILSLYVGIKISIIGFSFLPRRNVY